jgi:hypothetical protein
VFHNAFTKKILVNMGEITLKISYPKSIGISGSKTMKVNDSETVESVTRQALHKLKSAFYLGAPQVNS